MSRLSQLIEELCPNGVEYKELSEVAESLKKGTLKKTELIDDGEFYVINSGRDYYGKYNSYNNEGNALTIASRGEYAGFLNYHNDKFWAGGLCYPYRSLNEDTILTKFLFYFLKEKEAFIMETMVAKGSIPALNKKDVDAFRIPIPPIEVQHEIVRILDLFTELTTQLTTELTTELTLRKKQYAHYRDKLLSYEGEDVKWVTLGEVAEIYDGTHQTPNYVDQGIPFISVENISDIYGSNKYISQEDFDKYKIKPKVNDVFMTRIGSIGKCAVFYKQADIAYYVSLALIRPNLSSVLPDFIKYYIESSYGAAELHKRTLHHAVPIKVNKGDVGKIKLPLPPLSEQQRIVEILDKFDSLVNSLTQGIPAEIEARQKQYEYYRDKLLTFEEKH